MDRIEEMRVFVRTMERRSFTQAAEDLQLPRATVTNAVKRLEARLGTRLLERTTRTVSPTLDGEAHYQRCLRLLADMEEAEGAFRDAAPKGLLRVNVQAGLARHFLMPRLPAFLARYPGVSLHMGEGDRLVDLLREGVDCVLRAGVLQDSSMVARRVALLEQVTVASPAYLKRYGVPRTLGALERGHMAVDFISSATGKPVALEFMDGGDIRAFYLPCTLSVSGTQMYNAGALHGLGLAQVPRYHVESLLKDGSLREVLPGHRPPPLPVSVLYPHNRQLSTRVRVFADWVRDCFADGR